MKSLFILASFLGCSIAAYSQHDHSNHVTKPAEIQPKSTTQSYRNTDNKALSGLLVEYYNIKNALVAGDASSAASNAAVFLRKVNTIDFKVLSEGNVHILAKDAGQLSETKDLERQRAYFARLSNNMATIAENFRLDNKEVYLQYCPMKKASWLSSEKQIRNPYYGAAMLSCGEVTGTF
jgi:hypothetical protein